LQVEGVVALTVAQPPNPPGQAGFNFPAGTIVDAPPGVGRGIFGRCLRQGNTVVVDLDRADSAGDGLQRLSLRVPSVTTAEVPNASFVLGGNTFTGSGNCQGSATREGDSLRVTLTCNGMRSTLDPRTVAADVRLVFQNCADE
jgi:hypothetical protein